MISLQKNMRCVRLATNSWINPPGILWSPKASKEWPPKSIRNAPSRNAWEKFLMHQKYFLNVSLSGWWRETWNKNFLWLLQYWNWEKEAVKLSLLLTFLKRSKIEWKELEEIEAIMKRFQFKRIEVHSF